MNEEKEFNRVMMLVIMFIICAIVFSYLTAIIFIFLGKINYWWTIIPITMSSMLAGAYIMKGILNLAEIQVKFETSHKGTYAKNKGGQLK